MKQRVTLHEVAHAWTHQHLTDAERAQFLELRGLEHWDEPARWDQRGAEHAAELIAWGLLEVEKRVLAVTPNDRDSLVDGFRFLTGVDPICTAETRVEVIDVPARLDGCECRCPLARLSRWSHDDGGGESRCAASS